MYPMWDDLTGYRTELGVFERLSLWKADLFPLHKLTFRPGDQTILG
jgi:hypothetical protein